MTGSKCRGWVVVALASAAAAQESPEQTPIDRFLSVLETRTDVDDSTRRLILQEWSEGPDPDPAAFLPAAIARLRPDFQSGVQANESDDYAACEKTMSRLAADEDPFVCTAARFYRIKALVGLKDFEGALRRIEEADSERHTRFQPYSYHLAELDFLHAYCLVEDLQYAAASRHLVQFLTLHPEAPQRLVVPARQMLAELQHRQPGRIGEVSDLMTFAAQRLQHQDTGARVQERQKRALDLLDKLIEDAENREKAQNKSPQPSPSPSQQSLPQNPMRQSQLPPDSQGSAHLRVREANPGEAWGALPPTERERILQALRESFPGRYRRLVEQYYEQLAKEP